ncbi:unnamed protein product [Amoebophrya sp. A120]|nr:unnamed protein product [Amoebophrya sp. A120]|eukprot:GSA120T00000659001.1
MVDVFGSATRPNFFLWGKWGERFVPAPSLQQSIPEGTVSTVVGDGFMLALTESGQVMAWGASKSGCLGLGAEMTIAPTPTPVEFKFHGGTEYEPSEAEKKDSQEENKDEKDQDQLSVNIVELVKGEKHILARTDKGELFAWGQNSMGQLGIGPPTGNDIHCEPIHIPMKDALTNLPVDVMQIVAKGSSSFALSTAGEVYAWGSNAEFALGLDNVHSSFVSVPTKNLLLNKTVDDHANPQTVYVTKLQVCTEPGTSSLVIAFVEKDRDKLTAAAAMNGFGADGRHGGEGGGGPGGGAGGGATSGVRKGAKNATAEEQELYEGIMSLRGTLQKAREWTEKLELRFSNEEEDEILVKPDVDLESQQQFLQEFQLNLLEQRPHGSNTTNSVAKMTTIEFLLKIFLENVHAKQERVLRLQRARAVIAAKTETAKMTAQIANFRHDAFEEIRKLQGHDGKLQDLTLNIEKLRVSDNLTRELQISLVETLMAKRQTNLTKIELLKRLQGQEPGSHIKPALQILEDRWRQVKEFSLYNLLVNGTEGKAILANRKWSPEQSFQKLLALADTSLDKITDSLDRDSVVSRDLLIPYFCYELLLDNVKLRKIANQYQLRVLLIHRGKNLLTDPEAELPAGEGLFTGAGAPLGEGAQKKSGIFGSLFS